MSAIGGRADPARMSTMVMCDRRRYAREEGLPLHLAKISFPLARYLRPNKLCDFLKVVNAHRTAVIACL
jgi:hypothetical protein